jgi:hypothetical protein
MIAPCSPRHSASLVRKDHHRRYASPRADFAEPPPPTSQSLVPSVELVLPTSYPKNGRDCRVRQGTMWNAWGDCTRAFLRYPGTSGNTERRHGFGGRRTPHPLCGLFRTKQTGCARDSPAACLSLQKGGHSSIERRCVPHGRDCPAPCSRAKSRHAGNNSIRCSRWMGLRFPDRNSCPERCRFHSFDGTAARRFRCCGCNHARIDRLRPAMRRQRKKQERKALIVFS